MNNNNNNNNDINDNMNNMNTNNDKPTDCVPKPQSGGMHL